MRKLTFLFFALCAFTVNGQAQQLPEDIRTLISGYYGEWKDFSYPGAITNRVPNTALMGNGDVGVVSGGNKDTKTFYVSKGDFWAFRGSPVPIGGITIKLDLEEENLQKQSLAYGAAVTSSPIHPAFPSDRMVNGNWAEGYEGWVSEVNSNATANPFWAEFDLGEVKTFKRMVIRHDAAARPAETANITKAFTVSVKNTAGDDWTQVYATTNNSLPITDEAFTAGISARYVRLEITKGTQETTPDSQNNPRARIGQFELYAEAGGNVDPDTPIASSLHEIQDILNAEVRTEWTNGDLKLSMRTITSALDNLIVTEIISKSESALDLAATLWAKADNNSFPATADAEAAGVRVSRTTPNNNTGVATSYKSKATMTGKIIGTTFTTRVGTKKGTSDLCFTLQPDQTVYVVVAVGGGGRTYDNKNVLQTTDPDVQASNLLATITDATVATKVFSDHKDWWENYWSTSYVKLDVSDAKLNSIMKYYYAAQYMLGCSIREGKVAPGLYGNWHTTDSPSWNSDYHLNYNFISTFYGVNSSNRVDQGLPAIEAILQYVEQGKANAANPAELRRVRADFVNKKIAAGDIDAIKGIANAVLYPVGITPWGISVDNGYHNEALNAAFSAYPMIEYYNYTTDKIFLQEKMYDYLKLCVSFYEAWLEKEDGKYVLYAGYNEGSWATNPAVELSVLKSALKNLITASITLGIDADKRPAWENIYNNLAPQPTAVYQDKTVFTLAEKEWVNNAWQAMSNPVPGDGNIIPMESVIPGEQLGYYSPIEQLTVAKNTIDVFSGRGAWSQINNFPKIYPVAVNTRYPAQTIIDNFSSTINSQMKANLMIDDNVHGVEKAGSIETVNNMMLLSDLGVIKVFPNWITNSSAKFARLREKGAFVISSEYDAQTREILYVDLLSEAGNNVSIALPWSTGISVKDEYRNIVATKRSTAPNHPEEIVIHFATEAGKSYHLVKSDYMPEFNSLKTQQAEPLVQVYPNLLTPGADICIDTQFSEGLIEVFSLSGTLLERVNIEGRKTFVQAQTIPGVYLLKVKSKDGYTQTIKVIVAK